MANRYWVGGSGDWYDTGKWSASSGGASGASVPTLSDDVFFDANSASGSFTVTAYDPECRDFSATSIDDAMILSLSGSYFSCYGNWSNPASLFTVSTYDTRIWFRGAAVSGEPAKQILTNSVLLPYATFGKEFTSGTTRNWVLTSTLNVGTLSFEIRGTLNTSGYTINAANVLLNQSTPTLNTFTVTFNTINISTNLESGDRPATLQGNIINLTSPTAKLIGASFASRQQYINQINFTSTAAGEREISGIWILDATGLGYTGIMTFSTPTANGCVLYLNNLSQFNAIQTFNLTATTQYRYLIKGQSLIKSLDSTQGFFYTRSSSISYVDFFSINCRNASSLVGTSLGNIGNNNNITFQTARDVYWNQAAGGNWIDNAWALSAGGAVSYANSPLPQDTAYIVDTGLNTSATITINSDSTTTVIPNINGLSRTTAATVSIGSEVRFIGASYSTSSSITFSSVSSSYYLYLSPVSSAVAIDIAGTVNYLKLASSWTYSSGLSAFSLSRNLTVSQSVYLYNGTLSFNTYTFLCNAFIFYPSPTYLNGLNFTGGGLLKANQTATFKNADSISVVPEIIGTSNIEVGSGGVAAVLTLPDSTNSTLSAYGRKLNVKAITSSSFSIQGDTPAVVGTPNSETNIFQIKKLDFSSCACQVTLGNTYGFNSIAIYGDFLVGASTTFNSFNPASSYRTRQYWVMSADVDAPSSTTITTNGNTTNFGQYSALVFNAGDQELTHEFILGDNLTVYGSAARTDVSSAVGLVSGKLNLNGNTLSTVNFIIGPYYYVRWLNSTAVATWQDIYQKQLVFNGGTITVRGVRSSASQSGGTPSTWNTFGWECISSPSLVSIENGTSTGTISLRPYGDGYGYDTEFRGGCTTSNSTASTPSATPISYPCIVQNVPVSATNGFASVRISGNTIFNDTVRTQTPSLYPSFVFNPTSITVLNGDFTMVGGSSTKGKLTSTTTTPATITKNGTNVDPTNVKVSYTTVSPSGLWIGRQSFGVEDLGNNTGWIFTTTVTNNNITESISLSVTDSVLVTVTITETIQVSSSSIQLQYGEIAENMIIYQYSEPTVQLLWNNIDTDSPSLPDWDSNNSV